MTKKILTVIFGSVLVSLMLFNSALIGQDIKPSDTPATLQAKKKIDQTGINWVMPFTAAMEQAKAENKLLAIKMIAFGTNKSGCW